MQLDNEKMDNSGLAGKPKPMMMYEYTPPPMDIEDIMEVREHMANKRPDMDD
jgi:hypothetical protein